MVDGAVVLDGFAGTGALGLEALSRGAAQACFIEFDPAALRALHGNIAACKAGDRALVLAADILTVGSGMPAGLVFLDPPYGHGLVPRALARLQHVGRISAEALVVVETGRDETWIPHQPILAERLSGAARILIFRAGETAA